MSTAWFKLRYGLYPYSTVFRTAVAVYGTVVSPRRMCYYDDGHCWLGEHLSPIFQLSVLSQQYCGRMNPDLSTMAFYIMTMNKIISFLIYFWQSWLFNNVSCRSTCTDIEDNRLPDVTGFVHTVQFQSIRHHVTFFICPTNLQNLLKSRKNHCHCQPKLAVTRDWRIDWNCTVSLIHRFGIGHSLSATFYPVPNIWPSYIGLQWNVSRRLTLPSWRTRSLHSEYVSSNRPIPGSQKW